MRYNYLANTGLLVSEICFGTMTFGGTQGGFWQHIGNTQQQEANALIKNVFDNGVNFIDTANIYSFGESERLLGQAVQDTGINREELVIATKVRGHMSDKVNDSGLSRYHIFNSVDASLKRLQMDHVDILYVHGVDSKTDIEEIMRSLNDVMASGKVRYLGVCNWPAWMVMKANAIAERRGWHKFVGLQYYYALATRDIERELLPFALDQDLAVMPWSPLAGGFLSGKYTSESLQSGDARRVNFDFPPIDKEKTYDILAAAETIAKRHGVTVAQVALAWVRMQKGITSTIIGAKNADQLKDNLASAKLLLDQNEFEALNNATAFAKEYPEWMIERQDIEPPRENI